MKWVSKMKDRFVSNEITSHTLLDTDRLMVIKEMVLATSLMIYPMAEIGIFKGGASRYIASLDMRRKLYACDTFEGLPERTDGIDQHQVGDFTVSYEEVFNYLCYEPNIRLIKGRFPDPVIHEEMYLTKWFSFVHLDVDQYDSTLQCLKFFYPKMVQGGVIVSDDYNWSQCPGVKKAFDEFFRDKKEPVVDTECYSAFVVKEIE